MISDEVIAVFVLREDRLHNVPVHISETKVATLAVVSTTELATPDDECVIVHSARLEAGHPKNIPAASRGAFDLRLRNQ